MGIRAHGQLGHFTSDTHISRDSSISMQENCKCPVPLRPA